jgi:ribonuclease P protein component
VAARCSRHAARRAAIALLPNSAEDPTDQPKGHNQKFPRDVRLVRRSEFDAVYRAGKRRSSSHFTVFLRANELPLSRFGFSIKKALGGAVVRNRMRRRLREMVRCHRQEISAGWDIVIHPKSSVAKTPLPALTQDFLRLLKNL